MPPSGFSSPTPQDHSSAMSFRTLLRLRSAALQPAAAAHALTPLKPTTVSATAPYKFLLPRIGYSSAYTSPAPAPRNFPGMGSCAPAKKAEDGDVVIVAGGGIQGRRCPPGSRCEVQCGKACRLYGEMYALVYVLSWMIGRIIVLAARDGREWLRRYVRQKFSKKR